MQHLQPAWCCDPRDDDHDNAASLRGDEMTCATAREANRIRPSCLARCGKWRRGTTASLYYCCRRCTTMRPSCSRCKCALPCGISGGASGGCTAGAGMCARTSPGAQGPETTDCWSGLRTARVWGGRGKGAVCVLLYLRAYQIPKFRSLRPLRGRSSSF